MSSEAPVILDSNGQQIEPGDKVRRSFAKPDFTVERIYWVNMPRPELLLRAARQSPQLVQAEQGFPGEFICPNLEVIPDA